MTLRKRVALVIPIHNGLPYTLACLKSIEVSAVTPDQVIIVDDGSADGSAETIIEQFPFVTLLRGDGNLWWSASMNRGVNAALAAGADYILSLNNDCVVQPQSLEALVTCAEECGLALVCSKIRYWPDEGRILSAGGELNWWWRGPQLRASGEQDYGQWDVRADVDWVPGMGVLIPRQCFELVGPYDSKRFPHYRADMDFSLRAKRAGFRLVYEPRSLVWNDKSQTGLQLPERVRWRDVREILTSRRSTFNVRETVPFFATHSSRVALPFGLSSYYGVLFASLARRWVCPGRSRG